LLRQLKRNRAEGEVARRDEDKQPDRKDVPLETDKRPPREEKQPDRNDVPPEPEMKPPRQEKEPVKKESKEPPPPPKEPSPPPTKDQTLSALILDLQGKNDKDCIRAARSLARLGEAGRPAARALCAAALDRSDDVRQAALEALEKVHPRLYQPVLTLLVDRDQQNHTLACNKLVSLGRQASEGAPVLRAYILHHCSEHRPINRFPTDLHLFTIRQHSHLAASGVQALLKVAPNEDETIDLFISLSTLNNWNQPLRNLAAEVRPSATQSLGEIAKAYPDKRKKIVSALANATDVKMTPNQNTSDHQNTLLAVKALGQLGADAADAIPTLKKLKLHSSQQIRQAASEALDKIEK
jgi:hypothetical protein